MHVSGDKLRQHLSNRTDRVVIDKRWKIPRVLLHGSNYFERVLKVNPSINAINTNLGPLVEYICLFLMGDDFTISRCDVEGVLETSDCLGIGVLSEILRRPLNTPITPAEVISERRVDLYNQIEDKREINRMIIDADDEFMFNYIPNRCGMVDYVFKLGKFNCAKSLVGSSGVVRFTGSNQDKCKRAKFIVADVKDIQSCAFLDCSSLISIIIGPSVKTIGGNAFQGCTSLRSVTLPRGLTTIGNGAFQGCRSLSSIVIPRSVVEIGVQAFAGCSSLDTIIVKASNAYIDPDAFIGTYCDVIWE